MEFNEGREKFDLFESIRKRININHNNIIIIILINIIYSLVLCASKKTLNYSSSSFSHKNPSHHRQSLSVVCSTLASISVCLVVSHTFKRSRATSRRQPTSQRAEHLYVRRQKTFTTQCLQANLFVHVEGAMFESFRSEPPFHSRFIETSQHFRSVKVQANLFPFGEHFSSLSHVHSTPSRYSLCKFLLCLSVRPYPNSKSELCKLFHPAKLS